MSSSAFSTAAIACAISPPCDCRVFPCSIATTRSDARGSCPTTSGASVSITPDNPGLPKLSLYSDQPTTPLSVMTLR